MVNIHSQKILAEGYSLLQKLFQHLKGYSDRARRQLFLDIATTESHEKSKRHDKEPLQSVL